MFEHDSFRYQSGSCSESRGQWRGANRMVDKMGGVRRMYNGEELGGGRFQEIG